MKKLLFAATVFVYLLLIAISSNAQGIKVPATVQKSFADNFKNVQYSRWVQIKDAFVATLTEDGTTWKDAYFTTEGDFKGVGKFITTDRLPMFVQEKIDSYPNHELIELYQYECNENGLCYFAHLRDTKHDLVLKMSPYGDVTYSTRHKIKGAKDATKDAIAKSEDKTLTK
jgi:hypothetical protein